MPAATELRTVATRTRAISLLRRHAELGRCDVAVFDSDGVPVGAAGPLAGARPRAAGDKVVVEGTAGTLASAAPVQVFERLVGYVVASPRTGSPQPRDHAEVAARGAALLSDLCTREFELNDLSREILGAYEELNLFYDLSGELAAAPDAQSIARVIARKAAGVFEARSAWVLLSDGSGFLRPAAAEDVPPGPGAVRSEAGCAGRVLASRLPEVVDDLGQVAARTLAGWEAACRGALLTVPICVAERRTQPVLGVLQVAREGRGTFSSGDVKLASALTSHAAVLIENQRLGSYEKDLRIARSVQQALLPAAAPTTVGFEVAGRCVPSLGVGGDYFDHFVTAEGALGVVVADVSGHDLAAALVQTASRATIRAQVLSGGSPARVLEDTNRVLYEDLSRADMFLTAWMAAVDTTTGVVQHSDAGHVPALLLRAESGAVEDLSVGGLPIGVEPEGAFSQGETRMRPGDVLAAFTDGLTEARSAGGREEYGQERLAAALAAAGSLPAAGIVEAVLEDVARFTGGGDAADDRSLVVVKMRDPRSR